MAAKRGRERTVFGQAFGAGIGVAGGQTGTPSATSPYATTTTFKGVRKGKTIPFKSGVGLASPVGRKTS